jgi:hypothetical protein
MCLKSDVKGRKVIGVGQVATLLVIGLCPFWISKDAANFWMKLKRACRDIPIPHSKTGRLHSQRKPLFDGLEFRNFRRQRFQLRLHGFYPGGQASEAAVSGRHHALPA